MVIHGDCLDKLKDLPANSIDAIVTDPPYFLTNGSGSGFMGKEWDSLSVANAFAESILRSLKPVWFMGEENSVQGPVSTLTKSQNQAKNIHALYVQRSSIDQTHTLNLKTFSVHETVLTRAEVLALSDVLWPILTSVIAKSHENVLYVVNNSFIANCPRSIAQELALKLHTQTICEDLKILHSLMEERKTKDHIEATTGKTLGCSSIGETNLSVVNVESIVLAKRYSATTSSLIESQKTIRWITSLPFVRNAMAMFTANPSNIQILSERFHFNWAREAFRILKPGGHVLAFAGTRTYHPLANAIQGAGFEVRDMLSWLYGSGFPKSHNIKEGDFKGWGTALKPANEPICLARKPLEGTVAQNVLKYGTGAINVDASRIENIGLRGNPCRANGSVKRTNGNTYGEHKDSKGFDLTQGRWPANVLFDEEAAAILGEPSRFFYVAKASKRERNEGCEGMPLVEIKGDVSIRSQGTHGQTGKPNSPTSNQNHHPTVKPIKLMEYLIKLITPPDGTVLDPFMGSGSTGVAAKRLGFNFIGIEREAEYVEISKKRIEAVA